MANNLVTATCPNCNSPLQIKEGQDFVKCEYCGTISSAPKAIEYHYKIQKVDHQSKPPPLRKAVRNHEARKEFSNGYTISRYKGLGEMDAAQLGKTTMNKSTRTLIKLVIEDVDECKDKVDLFMGKDPERRKEWIANNIDFSHKEDYFEEVKRSEKAN